MRIAWLLLLAACPGEGKRPDGGTGHDGTVVLVDAGFDASTACADDSAFEPNDTVASAFSTSVDTQSMVTLAGLAICPATDKDHYRITLSAQKAIEVIVAWDSGSDLNLSLLNAGATSLANGTTGVNQTRVCVPNLPAGTYFAAVFATTRNNYRLTIKALASCP